MAAVTTAYLIGAIIAVVLTVGLFALAWYGWRSRKRGQSHIPAPPQVPAELDGAGDRIPAMYVATTLERQRLERVAVHTLGIRTQGAVFPCERGVIVERAGVPDFFIPREAITGVRAESGMAGKFVEKDGLVVVTWTLGETSVDTGFRPRAAADRPRLIEEIRTLAAS
ncbi:ABC transporter permease [Sediminivirga luteola]|uniref:Transporter n=1 Tax=Sediminivirga luteola TaxID=1774748 RepID=A0A8J2TYQ1_9MICO|nr:ABC transporter permease [Sediminivirga luteola]MCI2264157.1 ABC transporter permease [Sediminivirga luteola]GGA17726.1 transporter [Sediminivirga luteola]